MVLTSAATLQNRVFRLDGPGEHTAQSLEAISGRPRFLCLTITDNLDVFGLELVDRNVAHSEIRTGFERLGEA